MIPRGAYILHRGRTLPVVASVKSSGVECVAVMEAGRPVLIPIAKAQIAPARTRPILVWNRT